MFFYYMETKTNKAVIKKMRAAYQEFAKQMAILKKQSEGLLKKSLKKVDTEKMKKALDEIKNIS